MSQQPHPAAPVVPGLRCEAVIGRGSTSTVWRAVEESSGTARAVKVIAPERYHVGQLMELAARETAILDLVDHVHLVRQHGAHAQPDGSVAVVLDLAEGGSLADLVAARGRLSEGEVSTICTPLAGALAALHEAGVIHGDVAPSNVLFTGEGKPVLSDFEAARLVGEGHPPTVAGTPGFVAPEVVAGGLPTEASDVYGLGAIAWFALSGRALGEGRGPGVAPGPAEAQQVVGAAFAPAVVAMLSDVPGERPSAAEASVRCYEAAAPAAIRLVPPSPEAAATALTQRLRERPTPGHSGASATPVPVRETVTPASAPGRTRQQQRASGLGALGTRSRLAIVAALAVVLLALFVVLMQRQGPAPSVGPAGTPAVTVARPSTDSPMQADPQQVLSGLATARAAALVAGDPAKLATAVAPDSPMLKADTARLAQLKQSGQRYSDLTYHVRTAQWVSGDASTARVLAVIDLAVYRLIGPGTAERQVPAEEGRPYVYNLVKTAEGWRIYEISS